MKLSLVFSVLTSIVVLATAYPTQGATGIAKHSNGGKHEELDVDDLSYNAYITAKRGEGKHEELDANPLTYIPDYIKRDETPYHSKTVEYIKRDEGKREGLDADDFE